MEGNSLFLPFSMGWSGAVGVRGAMGINAGA